MMKTLVLLTNGFGLGISSFVFGVVGTLFALIIT